MAYSKGFPFKLLLASTLVSLGFIMLKANVSNHIYIIL